MLDGTPELEGVAALWICCALCTYSRSSMIPLITRCY